MNNKIASILKSYVETVSWADKVSGLVQTANVRIKDGDSTADRSYPIACDMDADSCIKGHYQDLAPDSKKKSVMYFEDRGGVVLERHEGGRLYYRAALRLVGWVNLKVIQAADCDSGVRGCGTSGDFVVDIIKVLPYVAFDYDDFYGIQIEPPNQVERSVDIFSRYTYNEHATQYLMFPYDYFALDIDITFVIPCLT